MCRLLGYTAPTPTTLGNLVGPTQTRTFREMSNLHANGWGTAWLSADVDPAPRLGVHRETVAPGPRSPIIAALEQQSASARIVHLRMATAGMPVSIGNTHPFLADGIAFAHNGAIVPAGALRAMITDPTINASLQGSTDSELYFALIRQFLHAGSPLRDAASLAVAQIRAEYPIASLNALLLSAEELIAVHSSENARVPVAEFTATGIPAADLPRNHLEPRYFQMSFLQQPGGTVFASSGIDTADWTPMAPASIAAVQHDTGILTVSQLRTAPLPSTP